MRVTLTGTLSEDTRVIDAETRPTVSVRVYYRAFSRWFAVSKIRGPLCARFACPVVRDASSGLATLHGGFDVPPDAPAGWYRVVFDATQNETGRIFCVDARVKFRNNARGASEVPFGTTTRRARRVG